MKIFIPALCCPAMLLCSDIALGREFELPLWRTEMAALGYQLPKPFGINLSYLTLAQSAQVNQIDLPNNLFPGMDLSSDSSRLFI